MVQKPTYEELEQRVKKLTDELLERDQMEKEIERIFNFSMDMIGSGNLEGYFTKINSSFGKVLGYSEKEILERPFIKFVHDDDVAKTKQALKDARRGKKEIYIENRYKCKDDSYKWIEWKVSVIVKENKFIAVGRDITERKQADEALLKSEEKYRRLFESLVDVFYQADSSGKITMVSPSITKAAGYKPEEVIGSYLNDYYVHPDERNKFLELISTNGFVEKFEVQMKKKDGSVLWASVNASLSKDQEGNVIGVEGIARDITNRKQAEEALKKSEERYRAIAENSRVGFWQTTLDGKTIYINPAMCRILEIEDPEELHGMTYESFYDKKFYDKKNWQIIKGQLAKRKKGISSTYEVELTNKKGTKRSVMISGAPIFLSEDKIQGSIATFIDITDKKKAESALVKAHAKLEQRVKKRTIELEMKTQNLKETNIAMKVLLKKREEDRKDVEYNVLTNVRKLIGPYFDKIRNTKLNSQQNAFLNIMESNLQEITSQFARKISMRDLNLTPTEIQVANMIRNGSSSKEIAGIMNISIRTVDAHRRNIRKKLGLGQKRANLRSYLLSLH